MFCQIPDLLFKYCAKKKKLTTSGKNVTEAKIPCVEELNSILGITPFCTIALATALATKKHTKSKTKTLKKL